MCGFFYFFIFYYLISHFSGQGYLFIIEFYRLEFIGELSHSFVLFFWGGGCAEWCSVGRQNKLEITSNVCNVNIIGNSVLKICEMTLDLFCEPWIKTAKKPHNHSCSQRKESFLR